MVQHAGSALPELAAVWWRSIVGESNDLSAANPQVAQKLLKLYGEWDAQLMKPRWPGRLEGDGGAPPAATRPSADADAEPKRRVGRRRPSRAP